MIIMSSDGSHCARVTPLPDGSGVDVVLYRLAAPYANTKGARRLGAWVLAMPLHAALQEVHSIVWPLVSHRKVTTVVNNSNED